MRVPSLRPQCGARAHRLNHRHGVAGFLLLVALIAAPGRRGAIEAGAACEIALGAGVTGAELAAFESASGRAGGEAVLGCPLNGVGFDGFTSMAGTSGHYQQFQHGMIEYHLNNAHAGEAFAMVVPIWSKWQFYAPAISHPLGYIVADPSSVMTSSTNRSWRYQRFEGDTPVWVLDTNTAFIVARQIWTKYEQLGLAAWWGGLPTTDTLFGSTSPQGHWGKVSTFERGRIWLPDNAPGAFATTGSIDTLYVNQDGPASCLGYPTSDEFTNANGQPQSNFDNGYITTVDGTTYQVFCPARPAFTKIGPLNGQTSSTNVALGWEAGAGALGYDYCVDTTDNGKCDGGWSGAGGDTRAVVKNLSPGTYYWQARAYGAGGMVQANGGVWWSFTVGTLGVGPIMTLDRTAFNFGMVTTTSTTGSFTPPQVVHLTQSGTGLVNWTVTSSQPWLHVTPSRGTGAAALSIELGASIVPASGVVTGTITINLAGAANVLEPIAVTLRTFTYGTTSAPIGLFDTPTDNRTGVTGAVPFTGWALDDVLVSRVTVCRAPVGGETALPNPNCGGIADVYVGDAVSIEGARPDVAAAFPNYPSNQRGGWGLMVLSNMLPNHGNGTYLFHMYALDSDGHSQLLGARTMTCANAAAVLPFGAIDTPAQGAAASGSAYVNFGWALTPQPKAIPLDGTTITVLVDGVSIGTAAYNNFRSDIAALFPGLSNSNGAVGFKVIDTTTLAPGLHTISWVVTDDQGATEGIGSRFFTVSNSSGAIDTPASAAAASRTALSLSAADVARLPRSVVPLLGRRGWDLAAPFASYQATASGQVSIRGEEMDRLELALGQRDDSRYTGFLDSAGALTPLPVGSRLDPSTGTFTWAPGVGFVGSYDFVFVRWIGGRALERRDVRVVLPAKSRGAVGPQVVIDTPAARQVVSQSFSVGGWASDLDTASGSGIGAVHVWAYPLRGGPPVFVGAATLGIERPDVASVHGDATLASGYGLVVDGLVPGEYDLAVFGYSTVTGGFVPAKVVRVTVR